MIIKNITYRLYSHTTPLVRLTATSRHCCEPEFSCCNCCT